jgi:hypothetical protein
MLTHSLPISTFIHLQTHTHSHLCACVLPAFACVSLPLIVGAKPKLLDDALWLSQPSSSDMCASQPCRSALRTSLPCSPAITTTAAANTCHGHMDLGPRSWASPCARTRITCCYSMATPHADQGQQLPQFLHARPVVQESACKSFWVRFFMSFVLCH